MQKNVLYVSRQLSRSGESLEEWKDGSALGGLNIFICREELQDEYGLQRPLDFRGCFGTIKSLPG
jgi:hypothetical protein